MSGEIQSSRPSKFCRTPKALLRFGVLRPQRKSKTNIEQFVYDYKLCPIEADCNRLVGQWLKDGAIFVGYLTEGDVAHLPAQLRNSEGVKTADQTAPGDVLCTIEQLDQFKKVVESA